MPLMDRINVKHFLQKTQEEKRYQITALQLLRTNEIALAKTRAGALTKSAKKNLAKRGRAVPDPEAALKKLLQQNPTLAARLRQQLT